FPVKITSFYLPSGLGVRIDTAAYNEYFITPYYDSLIAKVISYGANRDEVIRRMDRALEMTIVEGVKTTIPLQQRVLEDPDFLPGRITTRFLDRWTRRG